VTHVAVVLPGASYGPDKPGLAIPIEVVRRRGAAVTLVEYPGGDWPDWRRAETGDWTEITDALVPQIAPALTGATRVTLVAKSMGTSVVGAVSPLFPKTTEAIWITPLFHDPDVRREVADAGFRCLSVFGTEDPAHDPEGQAKVTAACGGVELMLDGVAHSMVMSDEQREALRAAVEDFL
jgi:hypothetical protein